MLTQGKEWEKNHNTLCFLCLNNQDISLFFNKPSFSVTRDFCHVFSINIQVYTTYHFATYTFITWSYLLHTHTHTGLEAWIKQYMFAEDQLRLAPRKTQIPTGELLARTLLRYGTGVLWYPFTMWQMCLRVGGNGVRIVSRVCVCVSMFLRSRVYSKLLELIHAWGSDCPAHLLPISNAVSCVGAGEKEARNEAETE